MTLWMTMRVPTMFKLPLTPSAVNDDDGGGVGGDVEEGDDGGVVDDADHVQVPTASEHGRSSLERALSAYPTYHKHCYYHT